MPIEIRELQIRAAVGGNANNSSQQSSTPPDIDRIKQEIVREVTEDVLRMIQLKLER